ncbi:MAG: HAD family hydrolase [Candidatus Didemnitutus sp.]|nr:HAD family hydrolase [Candidatus Didemnitutus sp.]
MFPRTVLFDLDGTLLDHFRAIYRCHVYAMRQLGMPEPTYAQVHAAVGRGLDEAIATLAGPENVARILPIYMEHWHATNLDDVVLLPGALELLQALRDRGVPSAVLTNKRADASQAVCAHLGLTPLLAEIFGAHDTPWLKPDSRFAAHALSKLGAAANTTVLVGDSIFDLAAAQNAGLRFLGVTTGTHTAAELRERGATEIFASLAEVHAALFADAPSRN